MLFRVTAAPRPTNACSGLRDRRARPTEASLWGADIDSGWEIRDFGSTVSQGSERYRNVAQKRVQWTRPSGSFFGKLRGEAPKRRVGDMFPAFTTLMEVWIHGYF